MAVSAPAMWIGLTITSLFTSVFVLWLVGHLERKRTSKLQSSENSGTEVVFVFEDDRLSDQYLDQQSSSSPSWSNDAKWPEIRTWLTDRFPDVPTRLSDLPNNSEILVSSAFQDDAAQLICRRSGSASRIILRDRSHSSVVERHQAVSVRQARDAFKLCCDSSPCPIWKTDRRGSITWRNKSFEEIAGLLPDGARPHPDILPPDGEISTERIEWQDKTSARKRWFEVTSKCVDASVFHYATDVTAIVSAETAQRNFVQTLTKTFANLTTGLAVFDKNRQLALFNPALIDLTSLPADFLTAQPGMMSFFDKLRDRKMMPEPANYSSWRAQINEVIAAASDDIYEETWLLPSSVTYRVTGRPHPDGAVAFLFEDISAEISLKTRFRSQLDLRDQALDKLNGAIAIVTSDHVLSYCNTACCRLWGIDPDSSFAEMSVRDLARACQSRHPDPVFWEEFVAAATARRNRESWNATTVFDGHHNLTCEINPLPGGASLVSFQTEENPMLLKRV